VLWLESTLLSPSSAVSNRRIVVLAWLIPALLAGCGAAGAKTATEPPAAVTTTTATTAPVVTTTTWPLSMPMTPPAEEYFDEPIATIGQISVPALGLDVELHQGLSLHNIDLGPSHWPGTALPGRLGNVVIAGHRVTHSRPFRHLDDLGPGAILTFTTGDGTFTYEWVRNEIVTPDRVDIADQRPAYTATLFACHPPGSARERIVAFFGLIGAPAAGQPDPATLPAT
jgi:sortase A